LPGTTPRQDARAAFKTILDQANLGVTVYDHMPYEGAEQRSVVLTMVSGVSRRPSLGLRISASMRALEEHHRLQIDCYYDDPVECGKLADKVEQAIMDHLDELEFTYDVHDVSKVTDIDTTPPDATLRESRIIMDFEFYTHRAIS
jgi:hypothetical protein